MNDRYARMIAMKGLSMNKNYFDDYDADTEKLWTERLINEFFTQNSLIRRTLGEILAIPNFVISRKMSCWGEWNRSTRTISLSRELLNQFLWDSVVGTLKHEMAHMIDQEILEKNMGITSGDAHGEGFAKACMILDIEPDKASSYTQKMSYKIPERERMTSLVYKLLALGESNHQAEAEAAVAKAHEIMAKYNIKLQETGQERFYNRRPVGKRYPKVPTYISTLCGLMSKYYSINHIRCGARYQGGQYYEFFGQPHNLDIAEYIFYFLLDEGERQWEAFKLTDEYKNGKIVEMRDGETMRTRRNQYSKVAFLDGFYRGYGSTLKKSEAHVRMAMGDNILPILANDRMLRDEFKKAFPRTCSIASAGYSNSGGYGTGYKKGAVVTINPGVSGGSRGKCLNA